MTEPKLPPLPSPGEHTGKFAYDEHDMIAYALQAIAANTPAVPDAVVSGALFDFAGFLTTRDKPVEYGASCDASPAVELLQQFAKKRGLSLESPDIHQWSLALAASPQPQPVAQPDHPEQHLDMVAQPVATVSDVCGSGPSAHHAEVMALLTEQIEALTKDRDLMEQYWNEAMATHKNIALLEQQLAEAKEQMSRQAANGLDAARYRWLRSQHWEGNKLGVVLRPKDNTRLGSFLPSDTLLDETIDHMIAIDAAIAAQEQP
jgi:hypothetical protein